MHARVHNFFVCQYLCCVNKVHLFSLKEKNTLLLQICITHDGVCGYKGKRLNRN